jgi:hypothetical protein
MYKTRLLNNKGLIPLSGNKRNTLDFSLIRTQLTNSLRKTNSTKPDSLGDHLFRLKLTSGTHMRNGITSYDFVQECQNAINIGWAITKYKMGLQNVK